MPSALLLPVLTCAAVLLVSGVAKLRSPESVDTAFTSLEVPAALDTAFVRRLSPDERERLGGLCRLAAVVLRTTALQEREAARSHRLLEVLEVSRGLGAGLDLAETAAAVCEEVRQRLAAIDADAVIVLRQDDGSYARPLRLQDADDGVGGLDAWTADALARQAVDVGRSESGRTPGGPVHEAPALRTDRTT